MKLATIACQAPDTRIGRRTAAPAPAAWCGAIGRCAVSCPARSRSEYNESFGSAGLTQVIEAFSTSVLGRDPRQIELLNARRRTQTIQSRGGIKRQAVAAIPTLVERHLRALLRARPPKH